MQRFNKILVGVDLSPGDRNVAGEVPSPSAQGIDCALWLAKLNSAQLTFFHALDISISAQRKIEESGVNEPTVMDKARKVLQGLVTRAHGEVVAADSLLGIGSEAREVCHARARLVPLVAT